MTLVVDAAVPVSALVDSGREEKCAESRLADGSLAAPEFVLAETFNILCHLEQSGEIPRPQALGSPLITLDRKLGRAKGPVCDIITPSRSPIREKPQARG